MKILQYSLLTIILLFQFKTYSQGVGVNQSSPVSMLDVNGNLTIGSAYTGSNAAPSDGAIIEGSVGIGTSSPAAFVEIRNDAATTAVLQVRGTTTDMGIDNALTMTPSANKQSIRNVPSWDPQAANLVLYGINTNNKLNGSSSNDVADLVNYQAQVQIQGAYNGEIIDMIGFLANGTASNTSTGSPSVRNYIAFSAVDPAVDGTTLNYGFYGQINSGAGKYNAYMSGTADNYFAGNVGIGTTDAKRALHVTANTNSEIYIENTGGDVDEKIWGITTSATTDQMNFVTVDDAVTTSVSAMTINRTGNTIDDVLFRNGQVGIGTSNATQLVHINGDDDQLYLMCDGAAETVPWIHFRNTNTSKDWVLKHEGIFFHIMDETSAGSEMFTVEAGTNANVGINSANPSSTLQVLDDGEAEFNLYSSGANTTAKLEIGTGGNGNRNAFIDLVGDDTYTDWGMRLIRNNGGANTSSVVAHQGTGDLRLNAITAGSSITMYTANVKRITIDGSGNVGIGSASPTVALDVNGSVNCTGGSCASDNRWKKDISLIGTVSERIMKLDGVYYYWRTDEYPEKGFTDDKQIGLIAQEVEKYFPELIKTDPKGYKSMDYMSFTAVLLEGIKELNAKVQRLEAIIEGQ